MLCKHVSGGVDLYRSLDGGLSWSDIAQSNAITLHPDEHSFGFSRDGSKLYIGSDGGLYSTVNPAASSVNYINLNGVLATILFYPGVSISQSSKTISVGGTQDNGTVRYNGTNPWIWNVCGDGGATAIDPSNANVMYTGCVGMAGGNLFERMDGRNSWGPVDTAYLTTRRFTSH